MDGRPRTVPSYGRCWQSAQVETVLYACTEENVNDEIPKADDDDDEGGLVGWQ